MKLVYPLSTEYYRLSPGPVQDQIRAVAEWVEAKANGTPEEIAEQEAKLEQKFYALGK
jgi:hypothetical protein